MAVHSAANRIQLSWITILIQNSVEKPRKWQPKRASRKACNRLSRNEASMSQACVQHAPQCVLGIILIAAWPGCSVNKMIFWIRSLCLRPSSKSSLDTSRYWVHITHHNVWKGLIMMQPTNLQTPIIISIRQLSLTHFQLKCLEHVHEVLDPRNLMKMNLGTCQ